MCSRCMKKSTDCTWDTPRSKRGRKSHHPRTLQTESGMGLFCLTPKNLIELNYVPNPLAIPDSPVTTGGDPTAEIPVIPAQQAEEGVKNSTMMSNPMNHYYQTNWSLPLPIQSRERFYPKSKSNSLEGLPSFYLQSLRNSARQRSDSLGKMNADPGVNPGRLKSEEEGSYTGIKRFSYGIHSNNVEQPLSDEERVRRKCSIGALINSDEDDPMAF